MYYTRQQLEENEDKSLAPYAMRSKDSKGHAYLDSEPEYRISFQRDRDRIIHTTAFRRLEYKTQVFINYEGDYYRTRLTHTLEVAQIGRTIARALGANEDLVEAICLVHDVGHPPFGHSGEVAISRLMKDFGGFDHNKQSLRIVTELEQRYPEFPGLNLTWEVREGIVKHESEYDISDASAFNPDLRGNLETQICNVADELAYTAHDLDDGLRSGMITPRMLNGITLWELLTGNIQWQGPELEDMDRHRLIRKLIGLEVTDLVSATFERIKDSGAKSPLDIQKLKHNVIGFSEEIHRRNRELKDFLYAACTVITASCGCRSRPNASFRTCSKPIAPSRPSCLNTCRRSIPLRGLERTICDYIAGMTDRYATEEHQKLFNPLEKP